MVTRLDTNPNLYTRALEVWQVLTGKALNRQTLTFEDLAGVLGMAAGIAVTSFVPVVGQFCEKYGLPPLTVLVVLKGQGKPGSGFSGDWDKLDAAREQVFDYAWFRVVPPTPEQLKQVHDEFEGRGG